MSARFRFLGELRRRSVFKVATGYVVSGWLLLQVASIVVPAFELSEWFMRMTLIALVAGFPVACALAWAYELTGAGLRRDDRSRDASEVDDVRSPAPAHDASTTAASASWETTLAVLVLVAVVAGGVAAFYVTRPATPRHLAVLPFRVLSADPGADVLAAGLMESLTSTVTQFGQFQETLWVVPAAEIPAAMTPSAARQRFGVSLVVSGSLQMGADGGRLTLNLIDAETERQIQSRQIDVSARGMIGLQDEAVRHLARMLHVRLSPQETSRLDRGRTQNPDADRLYLEGRGLLRHATDLSGIDAAIERFEAAVALDSTFALAAAGLGEAYWRRYRTTDDVQWVDASLRQSRRALALDSTLAPVWMTLGILRSDQRHYAAAIAAFDRAIALDPSGADTYRHLATVYRRQGELERAEATYRQAIARQPEYWKGYNLLGAFYYGQGRYDEAVAQYTHGLRLAPANPSLLNNVAVAYWQMERLDAAITAFEQLLALDSTRVSTRSNLATAYFYMGRYDEAARLYADGLALRPKDYALAGALADAQAWSTAHSQDAPATYRRALALAKEHLAVRGQDPHVLGSLAQYHARLGQPDSARVWLRQMIAVVDTSTADVVTAFGLGELYESLGDREQAWTWMRSALDRGYGRIPLRTSPFLAALRTDPRVDALFHSSLDP